MWQWIIIPMTGAIIGWVTNVLAIKLIFWPRRSLVIPVLNYSVQGLIPKRHKDIAHTLGQVIEKELIGFDDFIGLANDPANREQILRVLFEEVKLHVSQRLPNFLPSFLKNSIFKVLEDILRKEISLIWTSILKALAGEAGENHSVSKIVEHKINALDLKNLERLIINVVSRELRHIEYFGAVLGFLIGLFQVLIWSLVLKI